MSSVRLAEKCRVNNLALSNRELLVQKKLEEKIDCKVCFQDIYINFFFDGTNNNKYRDAKSQSQTNVARLFEVCVGIPAKIKATYGGRADKETSTGELSSVLKYYRKVYVPGLGTAFPEIKDSGKESDRKGGLAAALYGEARINWALLQVIDQLHEVLVGGSFPDAAEDIDLATSMCEGKGEMLAKRLSYAFKGTAKEIATNPFSSDQGNSARQETRDKIAKLKIRNDVLREREGKLKALAANRLNAKPSIRKIRISAFGFSRGAAEARVFCNWLLEAFSKGIAGVPLQIDFLGVFDTVASVGVPHGALVADGHMDWADGDNMAISKKVKRCVHLVSAHEVRGSFPVDSVCSGSVLPANCKEVVYPGVHSDVGGGYPPGNQGRASKDSLKISQVPLAQMYREARIAGVPLLSDLLDRKSLFEIDNQLRLDFNAYIEATRNKLEEVKLDPNKVDDMFPEETQPGDSIHTIMFDQYRHYLAWRKFRLGQVHRLPNVLALNSAEGKQDKIDIEGADNELQRELDFLENNIASVFDIKLYTPALKFAFFPSAIGNISSEKNEDWKMIRYFWHRSKLDLVKDAPRIRLFDMYVHDSRAWFKILADDDAVWFGGTQPNGAEAPSKQQAEYNEKVKDLESEIADLKSQRALTASNPFTLPPLKKIYLSNIDKDISAKTKELESLKRKGIVVNKSNILNREYLYAFGYLRLRKIYTTDSKRIAMPAPKKRDMAKLRKELEDRQKAYMTALNDNIRKQREIIARNGGNLQEYDKSSAYIYQYTAKWMGAEMAALK